jgi:hypothetical protein
MINEDVTISLRREGSRAAQTFQGLLSSARSDTDNLVIYCSDQRLVNILQENGRNTILVEPKRGDWYVRATVNGNMPKE